MSFSQELKDFVSGFKGGFQLGNEATKAARANQLSASERKALDLEEDASMARDAGRKLSIDNPAASKPTPKLPTFAQGNEDLDAMVRTVYGEAAGEPTEGRQAVAAVIRNRAQSSGKSIPDVVLAKGQFEPWMTPDGRRRMMSLTPDSPQYRAIAAEVAPVLAGKVDPTKGATHFYAPKAQRALGRKPPAWDDGTGYDLGNHRFFRRQYSEADGVLPLEEELPTVYAATGGVIEDPYSGSDENAGSNPAVRDAGEQGPDPRSFTDIDTLAEMTGAGMDYLQKRFKLDQTPRAAIPQANEPSDGVRAYAMNVGAAKPEEVEQIKNTVDPDRKLPSEELRAIAGWNAVYKYHTRMGNPERAQRAAAAMLMYSKQAAQVAGTLGLAAAEKGDKMGLAQAIQHGYAETPDGKSLKITGETPKGVKFQLVDENGDVTEQGEATMDQMVKLATGMQNGTEWFRAANLLRSRKKPDKVAERQEKERQAVNEYEGATGEGEDDFLDTLSPERRKAWENLPVDYRNRERSRFMRERSEAYKGQRFETRRLDTKEREDYRRRFQMFNTARQQGNWEAQREQVMDANDRRLALIERDLSDRNVRHQESQEARQRRYEEIDKRILERGTRGEKLTAAEAREQRQRGALELDVDAIEQGNSTPAGTDPEAGPWTAPVAAAEQVGARRAQHSYETAVKENKNVIDMDATYEAVDAFWKSDPARAKTPLEPQQREVLTSVAAGIAQGNNVPTQQAIRLSSEALDRSVPIKFVRDPRDPQGRAVQIGSNPPVRLGPDQLNIIAMARGGALNPREGAPTTRQNYRGATGNPDSAGPALPGASGNPRTVLPRQVTSEGLRKPLNQVQEREQTYSRFTRQKDRGQRMQALDIERP